MSCSPNGETSLNWSLAVENLDQDRQLLRTLLPTLLQELNQLKDQLPLAVAQEDWPAVKRLAHTIAGSTRIFGPTRVAEFAMQLEAAAENQARVEAENLLSSLQEALVPVLAELADVIEGRQPPPF